MARSGRRKNGRQKALDGWTTEPTSRNELALVDFVRQDCHLPDPWDKLQKDRDIPDYDTDDWSEGDQDFWVSLLTLQTWYVCKKGALDGHDSDSMHMLVSPWLPRIDICICYIHHICNPKAMTMFVRTIIIIKVARTTILVRSLLFIVDFKRVVVCLVVLCADTGLALKACTDWNFRRRLAGQLTIQPSCKVLPCIPAWGKKRCFVLLA